MNAARASSSSFESATAQVADLRVHFRFSRQRFMGCWRRRRPASRSATAAEAFTQMRSVFTLQRALVTEREIEGEQDAPARLTARDVIEFATVEGARTNGLDAKIGTLTPGKEADVVLLRTDRTNMLPFNNAYGAIVTAMDTSNVDTVIIASKVMKSGGKLVGVDLDGIRRQAASSRDYLVGELGWSHSVIDTDGFGQRVPSVVLSSSSHE